jgi:ATP-binding protein involved in chromosome partitioning
MPMDISSPPESGRRFRGYTQAAGPEGAEVLDQVLAQRGRLADRLARIGHVVVVASGKGGVGKSAVTANLAAALAAGGARVGALDGDINGPSLGRMLGAPSAPIAITADGVTPATGVAGVRLVSMELLLAAPDSPVRWRGPEGDASIWRGVLELGTVRELIADVAWGELDFLLVDLPPGTDRIERLLELIPNPAAVLLVTTPSEAACRVVARSARLLRESGVERVGLVINMSSYLCPGCGREGSLFGGDDGRILLESSGLAPWAEIPFEPALAAATDAGSPPAAGSSPSVATAAMRALAERVLQECAG